MTTDLLDNPVSTDEASVLTVYHVLKDLVSSDLPPTAVANLRDALASLSIVVTGLALDYEHLIDSGC
ncbi:hypothetical protein [Streptomyces fulvoviolaceus]|uniref:hypothetical protein n=1 Tax=Streptomyces fulvoviolaceus TaxID=285535 RepID=UPI0004CAD223|nr:hypothetical protein [Streptomyces fulvoviolaceus]